MVLEIRKTAEKLRQRGNVEKKGRFGVLELTQILFLTEFFDQNIHN